MKKLTTTLLIKLVLPVLLLVGLVLAVAGLLPDPMNFTAVSIGASIMLGGFILLQLAEEDNEEKK